MTEATAARVKEAETAAANAAGKALRDLQAAADAAGERVRAGMADAVAAAEASYEKLSAQVEANQAAAERATRQMVPVAGAAGSAVAEGLGRARQEVSEFVSERIRQDLAVQAELLGCRNLGEVTAVQMRFISAAVSQYGEEAARLAKLGTEVMTRMVPEQVR